MRFSLSFLLFSLLCVSLNAQGGPVGWASVNGGTTGGEGGQTVLIRNRAELLANVTGSTAKILVIRDTIELQLYERVKVYANKTIVGETPAAMIRFGGLEILGNNVIVQNLAIGDFYDGDPSGTTHSTDCITIYGVNVWIDHCWLWSGADGLLDVRSGNGSIADYITISNTRFSNHNKVTLLGSSDDNIDNRGHLRTTFYQCWYDGTLGRQLTQRMPRVRFADAHILNTYYEEILSYCVGANFESDVVVEGSYFRNLKNPHIISDQGAGLEDPDLVGIDNAYEGTTGARSTNGTAFVPGDFYAYTPIPTHDVPARVMNEAGLFNDPDNKPPTANTDTVDFSMLVGAVVVDVTANDTDVDGGDLRIAQIANETPGLAVVKNNALTYLPRGGASGVDTILYVLVDTQGGIDTGKVLVYYDGLPNAVRVYGESALIIISPNPARDFTTVELAPALANGVVRIFGAAGNVVAAESMLRSNGNNRYQLSTSQLSAGLYLFSVETNQGRYTRKLLVTK